jgi:hypothetical protein
VLGDFAKDPLRKRFHLPEWSTGLLKKQPIFFNTECPADDAFARILFLPVARLDN